jgi:hypothetical protein
MKNFKNLIPTQEAGRYMFYCPGCKCSHYVWTGDGPGPRWDITEGPTGDVTVSPSIRVQHGNENGPITCHFFIRNGQIEYLGDCTHDLKGQTVPLEPS